MATERLNPPSALAGTGDRHRSVSGTPGSGLNPELERRIAALEQSDNQGRGFGAADWTWLALLGIVLPAALLIWGWPG
jgi:hypothetical protein